MDIKENLAKNLVIYRKHLNITQAELAEKLNYSDKSVSKWERGDAIPDVLILKQIADIYGTTVDALLAEPKQKPSLSNLNLSKKRILIGLCATVLVWLIAVVFYSFVNIIFDSAIVNTWLAFIVAIPVTFAVIIILTSVWGKSLINSIIFSLFIWSLLLAVYLVLIHALIETPPYLWMIFLIGVPAQILTILFFFYKKVK